MYKKKWGAVSKANPADMSCHECISVDTLLFLVMGMEAYNLDTRQEKYLHSIFYLSIFNLPSWGKNAPLDAILPLLLRKPPRRLKT